MPTIEQRLEALERSARRWRSIALAAAGLVIGAIAVAAQTPGYVPDVIAARRVVVVNEQGSPVIELNQQGGAGKISIYDAQSKLVYALPAAPAAIPAAPPTPPPVVARPTPTVDETPTVPDASERFRWRFID